MFSVLNKLVARLPIALRTLSASIKVGSREKTTSPASSMLKNGLVPSSARILISISLAALGTRRKASLSDAIVSSVAPIPSSPPYASRSAAFVAVSLARVIAA